MQNKLKHYSVYLLLAAIHLFFVIKVIWRDGTSSSYNLLLIGIVGIMMLAYKRFFSHHKETASGNYREILAVLLGAFITYYLSHLPHMNAILASCTVGLGFSFAPNLFPNAKDIEDLPPAIYCGSFVGMSSDMVFNNIWLLINAGLVSGLLYSYGKSTLHGFGGKLGTIAFAGVFLVLTIYSLIT